MFDKEELLNKIRLREDSYLEVKVGNSNRVMSPDYLARMFQQRSQSRLIGNGVPIILARSERLSGRRPVYEMLGDTELRLTIYAAQPDDD